MSLARIAEFAREIQSSDARNRNEQQEIAKRIRELQSAMNLGQAGDLAGYLDLAGVLTEFLAECGGVSPEQVTRVVAKMLERVELAFRGTILDQPTTIADINSPTQSPEPALPKQNDECQLRMVHDQVLGEVLVTLGLTTATKVDEALKVQRATGTRIGEALVMIGAVTWEQVDQAVALQSRLRDSVKRISG